MSQEPAPFDPQPVSPFNEPAGPETPLPVVTITEMPSYRPVVTYSILAFTVFIWLLQMGTKFGLGFELYRNITFFGPLTEPLDIVSLLGMKFNELIRYGQVWRLFTPMFLHDNNLPIHLLSNMYFLAIVGAEVERYFGHARFAAFYVLAAFAGNTLSFMFEPAPSLGASTALYGLMAAEAIFIYQNRAMLPDWKKAIQHVGTNLAINIFLGLSLGLDNWGHFGGFLGGAFFCWFAGPVLKIERYAMDRARIFDERSNTAVFVTAVAVFLVFCALAVAGFFWGVTGMEAGL